MHARRGAIVWLKPLLCKYSIKGLASHGIKESTYGERKGSKSLNSCATYDKTFVDNSFIQFSFFQVFHQISINCHYGGSTTTIDYSCGTSTIDYSCDTITTNYCSGTTFFNFSYSSIPWRLEVKRAIARLKARTEPSRAFRLSSAQLTKFNF